jgi:hypothetical protein
MIMLDEISFLPRRMKLGGNACWWCKIEIHCFLVEIMNWIHVLKCRNGV